METIKPIHNITIRRTHDVLGYYATHAEELTSVGADAFGRQTADFEPHLAERFKKASLLQVVRHKRDVIGYALYNVLQGHHWRQTAVR